MVKWGGMEKKSAKKYFQLATIILPFFMAFFCLGASLAKAAIPINKRLAGKILLQVESKGESWYVSPFNLKRYYLGKPRDALNMMRDLGLGISENDYNSFNGKAPERLAGKILLRVEKKGEAYYVNPAHLEMCYLGKPRDAFEIMKKQGLGITNLDLGKIEADSASLPKQNHGQTKGEQAASAPKESEKTEKPCVYSNGCEEYKGVKIKWIVDEDTFPPEWVADKERINPSAESLTDAEQIERSVRIIKKAMDKYPEGFFREKKYLYTVYVVGKLEKFLQPCGGTVSIPYKKIFVGYSNYTDDLEQTFHHEYAHILFWLNYDNFFPEKEWDKINPSGFKYEYEKSASWGGYEDDINRKNGFLKNYSKTQREDDFAIFTHYLFKKETEFFSLGGNFWQIAEEYPKIRQKVDIVIEFYHNLDSIFTEEYFRKIGEE